MEMSGVLMVIQKLTGRSDRKTQNSSQIEIMEIQRPRRRALQKSGSTGEELQNHKGSTSCTDTITKSVTEMLC